MGCVNETKTSALSSKTSSPDSIFSDLQSKQEVVAFQNFFFFPLKVLTCVAKDVLGLSDSCHRNCLNLSFESGGNPDKS